jgi:hypothetical protein
MQKVVGSSPISRFEEALHTAGFFVSGTQRSVSKGRLLVPHRSPTPRAFRPIPEKAVGTRLFGALELTTICARAGAQADALASVFGLSASTVVPTPERADDLYRCEPAYRAADRAEGGRIRRARPRRVGLTPAFEELFMLAPPHVAP